MTYLIKLLKLYYLCKDVFKDVLGCAAVRRELAGNTQNLPTLSNVVLQILIRTYAACV